MLKELELERFKGFKKEKLVLGPLTLLVGANASGKSNIRDAFRFLHGISRGYTVAEIMGEKYGDGGERVWHGIRGGFREATFQGASSFAIKVKFTIQEPQSEKLPQEAYPPRDATYRIEIDPSGNVPKVVNERLELEGSKGSIFEFSNRQQVRYQPLLSQLVQEAEDQPTRELCRACLAAVSSMRFLDFDEEALRQPSFPGRTVLGDRGENLSSVLQNFCTDYRTKQTLLHWTQELTPMSVQDLEFDRLPDGKVLLTLIEKNGQRTTAFSASDGTLRFLAMMATLLSPKLARFYFFEEVEHGIYPARMSLLLSLIERPTANARTQIVASTHSPQLLTLASSTTLESASFIYRLPDHDSARIKRILDIPHTRRVMAKRDLGQLHATAWLEHAVFFMDDDEEEEDQE